MASTPLHYKLADMLIELMQKGSHRKSTREQFENGNYQQIGNISTSFMLDQEIAIVDLTIYDDLRLNGIKLLIQIQKELERDNPLWECKDKHLSEVRAGLSQLKEKDIIRPIVGTDMFIVNPEKIRRGKPLASLAALYQYSKNRYDNDKRWKISNADIRRLYAPTDVQLITSPT